MTDDDWVVPEDDYEPFDESMVIEFQYQIFATRDEAERFAATLHDVIAPIVGSVGRCQQLPIVRQRLHVKIDHTDTPAHIRNLVVLRERRKRVTEIEGDPRTLVTTALAVGVGRRLVRAPQHPSRDRPLRFHRYNTICKLDGRSLHRCRRRSD
ncbi:UNVERIFIED_ORG: hypothetical protein L601_003200000140 [Gordonia westfalica J30]